MIKIKIIIQIVTHIINKYIVSLFYLLTLLEVKCLQFVIEQSFAFYLPILCMRDTKVNIALLYMFNDAVK